LKPAKLSHVEAAALPLVGLTAWQALVDIAAVQPGQRVLIHGAGGGLGHIAVQLAKHLGAEVIGTASAGQHEFLRELGAGWPNSPTPACCAPMCRPRCLWRTRPRPTISSPPAASRARSSLPSDHEVRQAGPSGGSHGSAKAAAATVRSDRPWRPARCTTAN